ncbi:hypothetical protein OtV6_016 [Ostreococcus tauri virus RT-2011]|nr:hypothetical protein OtV6_016 [Ostreococcus tauri virus RT-2011]
MRDRKNMFINVVRSHSEIGLIDESVNVSVIELIVTKFPNFVGRCFLCVFYSLLQIPEDGSFENRVAGDDVGDEHFKVKIIEFMYDLGYQNYYLGKF